MENTSEVRGPQSPRFPWPKPGPTALQVTWSEFLKLTAEACENQYQGPPGRFIAAYIHGLSAQSIGCNYRFDLTRSS
jgi:hypothetical protein